MTGTILDFAAARAAREARLANAEPSERPGHPVVKARATLAPPMPLRGAAPADPQQLLDALEVQWPATAARGARGELLADAPDLARLQNMFSTCGLAAPETMTHDEAVLAWSALYSPVALHVRAALSSVRKPAAVRAGGRNPAHATWCEAPRCALPALESVEQGYVAALVRGDAATARVLGPLAVESLSARDVD